jgi:hypothetical protein
VTCDKPCVDGLESSLSHRSRIDLEKIVEYIARDNPTAAEEIRFVVGRTRGIPGNHA